MSAAILDARVFSEYYGGAKALHVIERRFPVEILYTVHHETDAALVITIFQAVNERSETGNKGRKVSPLKLIIMSAASLDARVFSEYYGGAKALHVIGRRFPVEILGVLMCQVCGEL
ncbi:hypothetical protein Bca52824_021978 [Brassica carinata]|uniref:Uncharacterized protein n=1 Tax=Brassica carinata TaxID=52824 RepID=A0A8X7VFS3_BRACI|nr:hypothetical protein Bca52824_021978 [Brassica carinata]